MSALDPMLPKAELHVHLEGSASPELIKRIAERNGVALPEGTIGADDSFAWSDFDHFLDVYRAASSVIRTAEDYRDITYDYLRKSADSGVIYVELTASPDHASECGLSDEEHLAGIAQGIDDAHRETGIEARIIVSCVRHHGIEQAIDVARRTAANPHPYVTGFGMAGDEARFPPLDFAEAFRIAADAGLGITVHAGELAGAQSVSEALQLPGPPTRIGHGVRAIEDPSVVAEIADSGVVLECCPTSNVSLGIYGSLEDHPIRDLREAGVRVTLNSDDPPYWDTTIAHEYEVAATVFGWSEPELLDITRTAIDASFAQIAVKKTLLERVDRFSREVVS